MSEEEKKAIEYLKNNCLARIEYDDFGNEKIIATGNSYKYVVLKLIEKQDKIIDLMAVDILSIGGSDFINFGKSDGNFSADKEKIKEHFRKKV